MRGRGYFALAALSGMSRVTSAGLISQDRVRLNGSLVAKSARVVFGDVLEIELPDLEVGQAEPVAQLPVVHQDADIVVVDKPAGMVVHPAPGNPDKTLVNALLAHCGDSLSGIGGVRRPGIVHRLDKDTSGVMVVAKNDRTHTALSRLFAAHDLTRIYKALVWGTPKPRQGTIDAAIARHPVDRKRMAVRKAGGGKRAVSDYWLEKAYGPPLRPIASLVGVQLQTGRTHQVRVHLSHIGCPVVGDPVYGRKSRSGMPDALRAFPRQALHAAVLEFSHPGTGKVMRFATELPQDLRTLIIELNGVK